MKRTSSLSPVTYPSEVDLWLVLVLAGSALATFAGAAVLWRDEGPREALGALITAMAITGFVSWVMLATSYTVDGRDLTVRSGPFRWRVPLSDIRSVEPARGFLSLRSGPALSMKRLVVTYRNGRTLLVSPKDQQRFMADIRSRQ